MMLTSTSLRALLPLASVVGAVLTWVAPVVHAEGAVTLQQVRVERGATNGTGTLTVKVTVAPRPTDGWSVTGMIGARQVFYRGAISTAEWSTETRIDSIADGNHTLVATLVGPSGATIERKELPFTITSNTGSGVAYRLTTSSVNSEAKSAVLSLTYPGNTLARTVTTTSVPVTPRPGCEQRTHGAKQLERGAAGGTIEIPITQLCGGENRVSLTVRESSGPILRTETLTVTVADDSVGGCTVTGVTYNADRRAANVRYTIPASVLTRGLGATLIASGAGLTTHTKSGGESGGEVSGEVVIPFFNLTPRTMYQGEVVVSRRDTDARNSPGQKVVVCKDSFSFTSCASDDQECIDNAELKQPPLIDRKTTPGGRARFTWLSAKCIRMAEDADLGAVLCVVNDTIGLLLELTGVAATALVIYGGFLLLISHDEEGRGKAKKIVTYALAGLVIILLSYVIVQVVLGGGIF